MPINRILSLPSHTDTTQHTVLTQTEMLALIVHQDNSRGPTGLEWKISCAGARTADPWNTRPASSPFLHGTALISISIFLKTFLLACLLFICLLPSYHNKHCAWSYLFRAYINFCNQFGIFYKNSDNLHTSFMITLYDLRNTRNKAQKAWEKFEENKMEEVSV